MFFVFLNIISKKYSSNVFKILNTIFQGLFFSLETLTFKRD